MQPVETFQIHPIGAEDRPRVAQCWRERWGADIVVAHGVVYRATEQPGFLAVRDEEIAGIVTYQLDGASCEIVSIESLWPEHGIGSALVQAVADVARQPERNGCGSLRRTITPTRCAGIRSVVSSW
jgi:hypothetical protein